MSKSTEPAKKISFSDVSCILGGNKIISGMNLSIETNGITSLIGLNGAGKTTTLRLMSGMLTPSSGKVEILGMNIAEKPLILNRIGVLPDESILDPELKVREQLKFAASMRVSRSRVNEAIDRVVEIFELQGVWNYLNSELSRGFRQRLSLGVSMIHDPEILILDEPSTGLDPGQIDSLHKMLNKIADKKCIVLSTHYLSEVVKLASRALVISGGVITYDGGAEGEDELKQAIMKDVFDGQ
ncbi:MAG: ABC transporter ATP-binding protein [Deltaproteobacteria bacterium]|nr:ABC transporter ATP-binding protein [Deltaproteobacteria bacterium]